MNELENKRKKLEQILEKMGNVAVAFSGGVDSSLLLAVAARMYHVKLIAVTASSISYAEHEKDDARRFAQRMGVKHRYLDFDQMSIPEFVANGPERGYYCKKAVFSAIQTYVAEEGFTNVVDGSNADDVKAYRPGAKALSELGNGLVYGIQTVLFLSRDPHPVRRVHYAGKTGANRTGGRVSDKTWLYPYPGAHLRYAGPH